MSSAITVEDVSKRFRLYQDRNQSLKAAMSRGRRARYDELQALDHVSLVVEEGTTYGMIGHNGSGKSTLLKCMARILRPEAGHIEVKGKVSALLELGAGFHPELSGRDNVYLNAAILGVSSKQVTARFDEIVEFAGLERFIDTPVKNYSSGMYVRLGFSVAINVDPDVLLIDEVLAVGDAEFQRRCNEKIADMRERGKTIVVVSHGLSALRNICDEIAWLDHGVIRMTGAAGDVIDQYIGAVQPDRRPAASSETRWGSQEVVIEQVELLDARGRPTTHLHTGERMTIRLAYDAPEPVHDPVFGLEILSLEGMLVTSPNTRDVSVDLNRIHGRGFVDLDIDHLMLLPGTYDITVSVHDHSIAHPYDVRQKVLRFDVDPGLPHETAGGVMSLGGHWSAGLGGPSRRSRGATAAPPAPLITRPDPVEFIDVPPDHPAHDDIAWLVARGVTSGYADGTFRPDAFVSRQAVAAFIYRFGGNGYGENPTATKAPFEDVPADAPFAGEITWLVQHGIASVVDGDAFRPTENVTRKAMAVFLYRFAGSPDRDAPACTTPPFPDVAVGSPFCVEIAWLARQAIVPADPGTPFEPDTPVSRAALASFLRCLDGALQA